MFVLGGVSPNRIDTSNPFPAFETLRIDRQSQTLKRHQTSSEGLTNCRSLGAWRYVNGIVQMFRYYMWYISFGTIWEHNHNYTHTEVSGPFQGFPSKKLSSAFIFRPSVVQPVHRKLARKRDNSSAVWREKRGVGSLLGWKSPWGHESHEARNTRWRTNIQKWVSWKIVASLGISYTPVITNLMWFYHCFPFLLGNLKTSMWTNP